MNSTALSGAVLAAFAPSPDPLSTRNALILWNIDRRCDRAIR